MLFPASPLKALRRQRGAFAFLSPFSSSARNKIQIRADSYSAIIRRAETATMILPMMVQAQAMRASPSPSNPQRFCLRRRVARAVLRLRTRARQGSHWRHCAVSRLAVARRPASAESRQAQRTIRHHRCACRSIGPPATRAKRSISSRPPIPPLVASSIRLSWSLRGVPVEWNANGAGQMVDET